MRPGVRLGVDVGSVRVGVAASDPHGMLATPVETVSRSAVNQDDQARLAQLVAETGAVEVVVGLPRSLSGAQGPAAGQAWAYAERLAARIAPVPVRMVDERLTTVDAHRALRDSGRHGRRRRSVVDQVAAVLILQTALDSERSQGGPPGRAVTPATPDSTEGRHP